jgi:hypothetical protein
MMSSNSRPRKKDLTSKFEKSFIPDSCAGLARSHKVIRIEREKEVQFMKLCCQIRFNDSKEIRSDKQREERKLKRVKKYYTQTLD